MTTKLRSLLKGQKGAVTRVISRFEDIRDGNSNTDELQSIEIALEEKLQTIKNLHEKIIDGLPGDDENEIETEVINQEEYKYFLQTQLQKVRDFRKVTLSNLNVNSQVFTTNLPQEPLNSCTEPLLPENASNISHADLRSSSHSSVFHRLPKLDLPRFDGNILEWQEFWDSYESAIHTNPSLSAVQKFNYLKSTLRGDAVQTITGFSLTNANYDKAVALLHERYGQKDKIIQTYMQSLLDVPAPANTLQSLRKFYDCTEVYIRGLDSLGQSECTYGSLLTPVILQKLPVQIRQNMIREHGTCTWTLAELMRCLSKEISILDAGTSLNDQECVATATFLAKSEKRDVNRTSTKTEHNSHNYQYKKICAFCNGSHSSIDCIKVKHYKERMQIVKKNKLCFNCLSKHMVANCKSRFKCKICSKRHHTSLCDAKQDKVQSKEEVKSSTPAELENNTSILYSTHAFPKGPVLLKTAVSNVTSTSGISVSANILFDEGAQSSFITEKCARELQLQPSGTETVSLSGFEDRERRVRHLKSGTVYLESDKAKIAVKVLIVPEISVPVKTYQAEVHKLPYLQNVKLAHPVTADDEFEIEILVGADHYWSVVEDRIIRGDGPTAVKSKIGYLVSGPLHLHNASNCSSNIVSSNTNDNNEPLHRTISMMNVMTRHAHEEADLEKFWKVETCGLENDSKQQEYDEYMKAYQDSCITNNQGKYCAKLPWKENHDYLPTNEAVCRRRTKGVVNRLKKEPALLKMYGDIIQEQEQRGFIEKVTDSRADNSKILHYIPHHPVRKDSTTTPIRIVYDCSCKSSRDSPSLNDCLMSTPPQLNDLTAVLLRFRLHRYAISTDIEKAFLNIELHENDRDATRFFWLSNPDDSESTLQKYRFKSVLFGATCSPFILNATILKHLQMQDCEDSDVIMKGLYVDNILSSFREEKAVTDFFMNSRRIFQDASFNLRAWSSNNETLRAMADAENISDSDEQPKVLGLRWNFKADLLSFPQKHFSAPEINKMLTKREILQESSSIFDPLGILSPVTVKSKLFMQSLWQRQFKWDEVLPDDIVQEWCKLRTEIKNATTTVFQRSFFQVANPENAVLHIFTDASTKAYGACAYIVSGCESTLVMAKNKVSPLKELTVPKLELSAAVIGAKLCSHITSNIPCKRVYLWSDSQIVLSWIASSKKLPVFVANRVKEIHTMTSEYEWRYCTTSSNPADLLSRGLSYEKFKINRLWMQGPEWLTASPLPGSLLKQESLSCSLDTETSTIMATEVTEMTNKIPEVIDIQRFSSYKKLLRVAAYVLRFINRCRRKDACTGSQTPRELNKAAEILIKQAQARHYKDILSCLDNTNSNSKTQKPGLIKQLNLYLDGNKIIRCKGRISNAPLPEITKFPYLLPPKDKLTELIIQDAHKTHLHSGVESTVTFLRQTFWIPTIRQRVRHIVRRCVTCRKVTGQSYRVPDPPPLPADRLTEAPPFTVTGIDYTGALTVKSSDGHLSKAYICLFTCANTRAVHLEVVPDLTTESFILAYRRFVSRKSTPKVLMSDNALTFIAASKTLKDDVLCPNGVTWKFIPQHAPWYGGWWERLIGITKNCIKKVLGKALVSMDMLRTIVTEAECIINDRPLTYTSSDLFDEEPLTPAHLIYGRRITFLAYPNVDESDVADNFGHNSANKMHRFKAAALDHFWSRWKHEYLTSLRENHRVTGVIGDIVKSGTVVQIHDENQPRNRWSLGVVQDVIRGRDGHVRAAVVRTKRGVTTRPVVKLYPLELQ